MKMVASGHHWQESKYDIRLERKVLGLTYLELLIGQVASLQI